MNKLFRWIKTRLFVPDGNIAISNICFSDLLSLADTRNDVYTWIKHGYKDRFFADPFILDVLNEVVIVLAEELKYKTNKGVIVKLTIDKQTKELLNRKIVLEVDTHLSYPLIYRENHQIYLLPENSQSTKSSVYIWSEVNDRFELYQTFSMLSLNDPTLFRYNNQNYCFATIGNPNRDLFLSMVNELSASQFRQIKQDYSGSRPAGNIIFHQGRLYRPSQDCSTVYGGGIIFYRIIKLSLDYYNEEECFRIYPKSSKYNIGTHHIDFCDGWSVCDGYGYRFSMKIFILRFFRFIKKKICS